MKEQNQFLELSEFERRFHIGYDSIPKCLALACCLVPHIVLCRMDPIFCRRTGDYPAESHVSLCPDTDCGISRALFLVCCRLAA